ncbi:hypothetical protein [Chryseolinea lacunae]|uniref:Uncharacterized protein n=1 Tax=Chryseolinea lacunae TaxID=2801331 RepID=A0ABS1KMB0_9BACT|nr:hypothetical protein [Chryseolinea lacunae]MBL0740613.1 hypothetical protein [Chryseolinea lacunae]
MQPILTRRCFLFYTAVPLSLLALVMVRGFEPETSNTLSQQQQHSTLFSISRFNNTPTPSTTNTSSQTDQAGNDTTISSEQFMTQLDMELLADESEHEFHKVKLTPEQWNSLLFLSATGRFLSGYNYSGYKKPFLRLMCMLKMGGQEDALSAALPTPLPFNHVLPINSPLAQHHHATWANPIGEDKPQAKLPTTPQANHTFSASTLQKKIVHSPLKPAIRISGPRFPITTS